MLANELEERIGISACFCGCKKFKLVEKKYDSGVHVGLYCKDCGTWIKWVSQASIKPSMKVEPEPKQPKQENLF